MTIAVLHTAAQYEALASLSWPAACTMYWTTLPEWPEETRAVIDFTGQLPRLKADMEPSAVVYFINAVEECRTDWPDQFIRFNGWPGFFERPLFEASASEQGKKAAEEVIELLGKKAVWTADIPGFVTARVLVAIINEAYLALEESVSTKAAIDTAMKLGTNYPKGPFEWAEAIGLSAVYLLLLKMAETHSRYKPAELLKKEAGY